MTISETINVLGTCSFHGLEKTSAEFPVKPGVFHDAVDTAIAHLRTQQEAEKNEPVTSTNADRIRAMSDEELAAFLAHWAEKPLAWKCDEKGELLYWLRQPVEEAAHA